MEKSALLEKIETLDIKESWKKKFRLYAEAGLKSGGIFLKFEHKEAIQGKILANSNAFGFLFGILYYLYLGLYKKAGLFFLFYCVSSFLVGLIYSLTDGGVDLEGLDVGVTLLSLVYISMTVNYDHYRKKVLGENFWR